MTAANACGQNDTTHILRSCMQHRPFLHCLHNGYCCTSAMHCIMIRSFDGGGWSPPLESWRRHEFEKLTDLTPRSSFQTVTAPKLLETPPPFLEHKSPSPYPQNSTTSSHLQSHKLVPSFPHSLKIHFNIIPIWSHVFKMVYFLQVSHSRKLTHFSPPHACHVSLPSHSHST